MAAIQDSSPDGWLLFTTRALRLFAYGFLSVILALYLASLGLSETRIGLLLTLTLLGDTAVSLWMATQADRIGRRRMLFVGAILMVLAGLVFALTENFALLLLAAIIGVISPSGNEVGPFLPIEQAALAQLLPARLRTQALAWYNLVGSLATAFGALSGGWLAQALQTAGWTSRLSYQAIVVGYGLVGILLAALFARLSQAAEAQPAASAEPSVQKNSLGLHRSSRVVFILAGLFSLDAFAGGFVIQTTVAYWFYLRFGVSPAVLGSIFFGANLLAGVSALSAAWIARRIGLLNTMVFTHLPSNVLLMLVPLMPTLELAILVLLLRFSISQMDVPTRQAFTLSVVEPDERSAASGITGVARTIGASLGPFLAGLLVSNPALLSVPFWISGGLKIIYDLTLYRWFRAVQPPSDI